MKDLHAISVNMSCKEQWNIYDRYIFCAILGPTVDEVITSDVMNTFSNFHIPEINPGFQNTLKEILIDFTLP
jgi:hypothetical protein